MISTPCIICGQPRHETRLDCGSDACRAAVEAMPFEELNEIRMREALAVWRANPMPADGRGVYIHFGER